MHGQRQSTYMNILQEQGNEPRQCVYKVKGIVSLSIANKLQFLVLEYNPNGYGNGAKPSTIMTY